MDWNRWRAEFDHASGLTHLNHAGLAPVSRRVASAVTGFIEQARHPDKAVQVAWEERGEAVRASLARLVGAGADEIAFVKNTSEGLSLVAAGLDWQAGDNVIAIEGEYPSNVYPWWSLRRWGVECRMVKPVNGRVTVDAVAAAADARTRVLAVSFVDWQSGARTDLAALGQWCRERGLLLCVDAIQGVGALQLDAERAGIDCLAVGGHKWLLAPEGCGFLYVSRKVLDRVHSVLHGWKSVPDPDTYLPYHFDVRSDAAKFEPGSPPQLGVHALGAAVDLLLEIGPRAIEQRIYELTDHLAEGLRRRGCEIVSPWERNERSGIVVFRGAFDPQTLLEACLAERVIVRVRGGGIRVAPHFHNGPSDLERLFEVLDRSRCGPQ